MKNIRQIHLFLGTFFAPAIVFFALSGIFQIFGLHESKERGGPPPIAWIADLAEIHKNQRLRAEAPPRQAVEHAHDQHEEHAPAIRTLAAPQKSAVPTWALKAFALLMAMGLICTALIGIIIAVQNPRTRRNAWISLAVGTALPLVLLYL